MLFDPSKSKNFHELDVFPFPSSIHYLDSVGDINIDDIIQIHDNSFRLSALWDRKCWSRNLK
jgi:hypothetical protein